MCNYTNCEECVSRACLYAYYMNGSEGCYFDEAAAFEGGSPSLYVGPYVNWMCVSAPTSTQRLSNLLSSESGLSTGIIVVIAIGSVLVAVLLLFSGFLVRRRLRRNVAPRQIVEMPLFNEPFGGDLAAAFEDDDEEEVHFASPARIINEGLVRPSPFRRRSPPITRSATRRMELNSRPDL